MIRRQGHPTIAIRPGHRRAFSPMELIVVLGIVVILFSIFVPYVWKMREADRRAGCANNLRAIHAALTQYADANHKDYPRTAQDPAGLGYYVVFTGADSIPGAAEAAPTSTAPSSVPSTLPVASPIVGPAIGIVPAPSTAPSPPTTGPTLAPASQPVAHPAMAAGRRPPANAVQFNDVTASLWLVVRLGYAEPTQFVCPGSDESADPMLTNGRRMAAGERSNFTSGRYLSYSYCSPFSGYGAQHSPAGGGATSFRLNSDTLPADFAIAADKNPGISANGDDVTARAFDAPPLDLAIANSRNHGRAGQNVLYVTGEVRFQKTPYCGFGADWKRDNIYTALSATPAATLPVGGSLTTIEARGVCTDKAGPAWEKDSYLVPTAQE